MPFSVRTLLPRRPHRRAGKEGDEITQLHSKPPSQPEKEWVRYQISFRAHANAALQGANAREGGCGSNPGMKSTRSTRLLNHT